MKCECTDFPTKSVKGLKRNSWGDIYNGCDNYVTPLVVVMMLRLYLSELLIPCQPSQSL